MAMPMTGSRPRPGTVTPRIGSESYTSITILGARSRLRGRSSGMVTRSYQIGCSVRSMIAVSRSTPASETLTYGSASPFSSGAVLALVDVGGELVLHHLRAEVVAACALMTSLCSPNRSATCTIAVCIEMSSASSLNVIRRRLRRPSAFSSSCRVPHFLTRRLPVGVRPAVQEDVVLVLAYWGTGVISSRSS